MSTITEKFNPQVNLNFKELFKQDFSAHNAMIEENEEKRRKGEKVRNSCVVGFNVRITLADPRTNPEQYSFEDMHADPEIHGEMLLRMAAWTRSKMKFDWQMGLPKEWKITPYAANVYEDILLGGEVVYPGGYETPATRPHFTEANGFEKFMNFPFKSLPDHGYMKNMHDTYLYFKEKSKKGWEFLGRPVVATAPVLGTDGPFTVACNTFGPQEMCLMALDDPEKASQIMTRIVDLTVKRIKEVSLFYGQPWHPKDIKSYYFADDMIALISSQTYIDLILPLHKKLIRDLAPNASSYSIHLCGNASRHFKTIKDELGVKTFDTGFPINFDNLRDELGNDVTISGGPKCSLFLEGKKELIAETIRIAKSRTALEGPFIMREGNNLPPLVSDEMLKCFYEAAIQ